MAYRPRRGTPLGMRITANTSEIGMYDVSENGITYTMDLETTRLLKDYYKGFRPAHRSHFPTMERWYQDLPNDVRKRVKRTGNVPPPTSDFFPDPDYD